MATFRTIAKLWPTGEELDLGDDTNEIIVPPATSATFSRNANEFVITTGPDQFQFLFWNTGRHLTRKRRVRWNFTRLDWSLWSATRWYGIPEGGDGGPARARVDALRLGNDTPFSDSPIDGPNSTFAAGAFPFNGNDHEIGTANGPCTIAAEDPFHALEFAGWLRLIFGGDSSGEFVETDVGDTPGSSGFGVFEHVTGQTVTVPQGQSRDYVAAYGNSTGGGGGFGRVPKWVLEIFERGPIEIPDRGDPGPWDLIRIRVLQDILRQTQPAEQKAGGGGLDLQKLIEAAPNMSAEELQRSLKEIETTSGLVNTAKRVIEGKLKK